MIENCGYKIRVGSNTVCKYKSQICPKVGSPWSNIYCSILECPRRRKCHIYCAGCTVYEGLNV